MKGYIVEIDSKTAIGFLLPKHYSGRTPPHIEGVWLVQIKRADR
jgi:hypothetical protein